MPTKVFASSLQRMESTDPTRFSTRQRDSTRSARYLQVGGRTPSPCWRKPGSSQPKAVTRERSPSPALLLRRSASPSTPLMSTPDSSLRRVRHEHPQTSTKDRVSQPSRSVRRSNPAVPARRGDVRGNLQTSKRRAVRVTDDQGGRCRLFEHDAEIMVGYCEGWLERIPSQEEIAERIGAKAFLK
jgi:hypothetical protein